MNLSFTTPAFLWALPLAAAPVIIHLIFRKKPIIVDFSFIHFIKLASRKNIKYSKLQNILLMIIRTLIILGAVFLFSRPVFYAGRSGDEQKDSARSYVVLIDTSYSMGFNSGGGVFFDNVKDAVYELIQRIGPNDKAVLIAFSDRVEYMTGRFTSDKQLLAENLSEIKLSSSPGSIQPAMQAAFDLISESGLQNNIVVVFSDLNKNGWEGAVFTEALPDAGFKVVLAYSEYSVNNTAITNLDMTGTYYNEGSEIHVTVMNFNDYPVKQGIDIFIDGAKRAQGLIELGKYEERERVFRISLPESPGMEVSAKLRHDDLPADDTFYYYKNIERETSVLVVDGDPKLSTIKAETFFLRTALSGGPGTKGIKSEIINAGGLNNESAASAGVIFLCNVEKLQPGQVGLIRRHLERGGVAVFTAGDKIKKENYDLLNDILPVEILTPRRADEALRMKYDQTGKHELSEKLPGYDYKNVIFSGYILSRPRFGAKTIISLENGAPLVVEQQIGSGRSVFFSSSIDDDWTNFPFKPLYPVFLEYLVKSYGREHRRVFKNTQLLVGERISARDFGELSASSGIILTGPGSTRIDLSGMFRRNQDYELERPGIYRVEFSDQGTIKKEWFDVNLRNPREEGDFRKADFNAIDKLFAGNPVIRLDIDGDFIERLFTIMQGREISGILFWVLLFLLLSETAVIYAGKKNN